VHTRHTVPEVKFAGRGAALIVEPVWSVPFGKERERGRKGERERERERERKRENEREREIINSEQLRTK
jgi:hypothetical protein